MGEAAMHVKDCDCIDASRLGGPVVTDPLCAALDGGPRPTERVSGVDELVAFVRRCLDEDERVAQAASGFPWEATISLSGDQGDVQGVTSAFEDYCCSAEDATHIARWDPARVLAEVEAKRRILDDYDILVSAIRRVDDVEGNRLLYARREARESDIRWLAQPYAGQDGWREEWAL
jgi:hypothetical protein